MGFWDVILMRFWDILFEPEEQSCFGVNTYETAVEPVHTLKMSAKRFFVINPLHTSRKDDNVVAFRNILVEFDKGSIEEQRSILEKSELPYSTLVYSGGKSLHAIISLQWALTNKQDYKDLVKRVYDKLGGAAVVDTATSNPSRFSRVPGVMRENGKEQALIEIHDRIPNVELLQWLGPAPEKTKPNNVIFFSKRKLITSRAMSFLNYGAPEGAWNQSLFSAACDLFRCGYTLEEVEHLCTEITGHLDSKDRSTIRSAQRTVGNV
jgi:hypothetical protein